MGTKLYVGNLNYNTNEESLRRAFSANGREVASVSVIMDRETGRSRGFAFVEMATAEGAQEALRELDGTDLDGRTLRINEARERDSRGGPPRTGGPGGYAGPPRGPRPGGYSGGPPGGGPPGGGYGGGAPGGGYAGGGGAPSGGFDRGAGAPAGGAPPSFDRQRNFGPPAEPGGARRPERGTGRKDRGKEARPVDVGGGKRGGAKRRGGDDGDDW